MASRHLEWSRTIKKNFEKWIRANLVVGTLHDELLHLDWETDEVALPFLFSHINRRTWGEMKLGTPQEVRIRFSWNRPIEESFPGACGTLRSGCGPEEP